MKKAFLSFVATASLFFLLESVSAFVPGSPRLGSAARLPSERTNKPTQGKITRTNFEWKLGRGILDKASVYDEYRSNRSTLDYLNHMGNVNFNLVDWVTLNQWLSVLNGNDQVGIKIPKGLNRGNVLQELQDRLQNKPASQSRAIASTVTGMELGCGNDWRQYENDQGYTHLEELFLFQPKDWRKQAREYFFAHKCDLLRKSSSKSMRMHSQLITKRDGKEMSVRIFMESPLLVVLFHPKLRRVERYEPLNFLLSYGAIDPLPELIGKLKLTKEFKEAFLLEMSPLDYFFEFQRNVERYNVDLLSKIGKTANVPRLPLLTELDFSKIVGQRLAKSIIREQVVTYFWGRGNEKGGVPIRHPLSMIFAGPSGNGKTELALEMAELLNRPGENAFHKVDCGKLSHSTEVFGLSGGYQGSYEGSALNNFIVSMSQTPDQIGVVLLDELDKVEEEVIKGLYQILDKGEWTNKKLTGGSESQTSVIPCRNVIFIMTVNSADSKIMQYANEHPDIYTAQPLSMTAHRRHLQRIIQSTLQTSRPFTAAFVGRVNAFVPFIAMSAETNPAESSPLQMEMMTVAKLLIEREVQNIEIGSDLLQFKQSLSSTVKHDMAEVIVGMSTPEAGVRSIQNIVAREIRQQVMHKCLLDQGGIGFGSEIQYHADVDEKYVSFKMTGFGNTTSSGSDASEEVAEARSELFY